MQDPASELRRTPVPHAWVNNVRCRPGALSTPAPALAYDLRVFTARRQHDLPIERVRSRAGAYVYGNILVLAAIFATSPQSISHWSAVVIVVATSATTFFAHVFAHRIGQAIGRTDDEGLRLHLAQEARDAVPIMNSGAGPALLLALGALGWFPPWFSQLLAEAYVVVRLAGTGIIVRGISGEASSLPGRWSGLALAGVSIVIAALKNVLTH
jgi:hypothetical protein